MKHFLDIIEISSKMFCLTSAYLFLKAASVLLSKGKSFPRHCKPNAGCTVVPLTLILATPVGARINTREVFQESQHGVAALCYQLIHSFNRV